MNDDRSALNIGIVLLSQDFHVIGINDYARDIYGPVLKELGNSVYRCHSQKSRDRVAVLLKELTAAPTDMPRTMVIDVLGKVIMYNLSRLSVIYPAPHAVWSVSFMDVSEQTVSEKNPLDGMLQMKRVPVYDSGEYKFIPIDEVYCIQSDGDYCKIYTATKCYYMSMSLKTILQRYRATNLFQVHKSFVVNLVHVSSLNLNDKNQARVQFDNAAIPSVPVSRRRLAELKRAIHPL